MIRLMLIAIVVMIVPTLTPAANTPAAPNGISLSQEYKTVKIIAPSSLENKGHIPVIYSKIAKAP